MKMSWDTMPNADYINRVIKSIEDPAFHSATRMLQYDGKLLTCNMRYWGDSQDIMRDTGIADVYVDIMSHCLDQRAESHIDVMSMLMAYSKQSFLLDMKLEHVQTLSALGNPAANLACPWLQTMEYIHARNLELESTDE